RDSERPSVPVPSCAGANHGLIHGLPPCRSSRCLPGWSRGRPCASRAIVASMAVATQREYGLFIDGALVEPASGEVRELREPATGEPLGKAAMAGEGDVDRAVDAARAALEGAWGR